MTQQRKAQAVTIAILVIVVAVIAIRQTGWRPSMPGRGPSREATPQDAIYAMLDAAREGDVDTYLSAYAGQMQASLKQAITESTEEGFAKYLRDSNAPIKGIAITEPEKLTDREVKVRVEYVFQDRNEVQHMYLERTGGDWLITRVDSARRIKTLVPYGTPVQ